jgi:hypothetical protein
LILKGLRRILSDADFHGGKVLQRAKADKPVAK